jgi:hypothetical protein
VAAFLVRSVYSIPGRRNRPSVGHRNTFATRKTLPHRTPKLTCPKDSGDLNLRNLHARRVRCSGWILIMASGGMGRPRPTRTRSRLASAVEHIFTFETLHSPKKVQKWRPRFRHGN